MGSGGDWFSWHDPHVPKDEAEWVCVGMCVCVCVCKTTQGPNSDKAGALKEGLHKRAKQEAPGEKWRWNSPQGDSAGREERQFCSPPHGDPITKYFCSGQASNELQHYFSRV